MQPPVGGSPYPQSSVNYHALDHPLDAPTLNTPNKHENTKHESLAALSVCQCHKGHQQQQASGIWKRASLQQGDIGLSGTQSGQVVYGGARTREKMVPSDLRADSLSTVPRTPLPLM
ncbi:hypothetical protein PoB_004465500 [Plakobranchus ocellatus]|uniref:Uncharacterized protein n=1 Tax=Plakobranchus ocellatus TaxID=259542 RepID=A0AAV4BGC2_9GAST|nr:hypothetical protein PoB_004465500 [Plakobranchus ocellatus]